jgi:hypothetical protein
VDHFRQEPGAIEPLPLRIGVRIVLPDIAQAGRTQERIGHRVTDHVGIGVPDQSPWMRNPQSSQNQWPTLAQPMCVVADPDPQIHAPSQSRKPRLPSTLPGVQQNRSVFLAGWLSRQVIFPRIPFSSGHSVVLSQNYFKFCTEGNQNRQMPKSAKKN